MGAPSAATIPFCWQTARQRGLPRCSAARTLSAGAIFSRSVDRAPWIFLSGVRAEPRLDPGSTQKVFRRGDPHSPFDRGIIGALTGISGAELGRHGSVDSNVARATQRAVEQAGIRPRLRSRRVGDYELGEQLGEGEGWQDFLAKHVSLGVARRVRIYPFTRAASPEERKRLG